MAIRSADNIIILSGGGTGGHITPILAVASEIKKMDNSIKTIYIGERGGKFKDLTENHPSIDESYEIFAGKFRRYNGESWLERIVDVKTILLNIRDLFYLALGTVQSVLLVRRIRPRAIFLKGGFVGVPVGLASVVNKVPFLTHDSDAIPGLANRLVSRWAALHAVASDVATYNYPQEKTVQVGVLVEPDYGFVSAKEQAEFKAKLNIPTGNKLVLVTGGSSGAQSLNLAVLNIALQLLKDYPKLNIIHQTGRGKQSIYGTVSHDRLSVVEFMRPMHVYSGASDIVVCRASGNTLAELGTQQKAVITVPNPLLASGHQLKNAEQLLKWSAAIVVDETKQVTNSIQLDNAIRKLLDDPSLVKKLSANLHANTLTGASKQLAKLLMDL